VGCEAVERTLEELLAGCRGNVDRLRGEMERIGKLLADAEGELERLLTARQVLAELPDVHPPTVKVELPAVRSAEQEPGPGGGLARRRVEREAFTAMVLDVLAASRSPMRCKDVVAALGGDPEVPREAEKIRHHLKREKQAGRVVEREAGLFTLARGVAVVDG
jgi:hypothetical protein